MPASQLRIACVFAALLTLSMGSAVSPEECQECRGKTRGGLQSSEDATSLLQLSSHTREKSETVERTKNVPVFKINLDDTPRMRFVQVARHFKDELKTMQGMLKNAYKGRFNKTTRDMFLSAVSKYPEYLEEIKGVVLANGITEHVTDDGPVTVESLVLSHMLYEIQHSETTSSSILFAGPDDQVFHGCSMENNLQWWHNNMWRHIQDMVYEAHYYKGGKLLYKATQWLPAGGITTASRVDGWSFAQQSRPSKNDWKKNLAAAQEGGEHYGFAARHIMETTPDFQTALKKLTATEFMAPSYFVLAGAKPEEGAVMTVERLKAKAPPIEFIRKPIVNKTGNKTEVVDKGARFMVQTNDEPRDEIGSDARRMVIDAIARKLPQSWMNTTNMVKFVHDDPMFVADTPIPMFTAVTQYQNVMLPKTGFYNTVLQHTPGIPKLNKYPEIKGEMWSTWNFQHTARLAEDAANEAAKDVMNTVIAMR